MTPDCCRWAPRHLRWRRRVPALKSRIPLSPCADSGARTTARQTSCRGWRGRFSVDRWDENWPEATKRDVIRSAWYIHAHKGTIGAVRRVVEPLGYLINVSEWWQTNDPPGTFRLDIGVLETGITEEMYYEMERLIADAKPASRHLIGLNIIQDIPGYLYTGALSYDGDIITVYPG